MARKIPDVISQIYILQTSARSSLFHYLVRFSVQVEEHFSTLQLSQFPIPPPWTPGGGATPRTTPSEMWGAYKTLLKLPWLMMMVKPRRNFSMESRHCGLQTTAPGAGNHYLARFTFRTSGGGAYSPSSNLVVSSVKSCRGCRRRRFSKMPLTKSTRMSSMKIII